MGFPGYAEGRTRRPKAEDFNRLHVPLVMCTHDNTRGLRGAECQSKCSCAGGTNVRERKRFVLEGVNDRVLRVVVEKRVATHTELAMSNASPLDEPLVSSSHARAA